MRTTKLYSICGLAVLIWGCPKRQTTPRVVYMPAPPAASAQESVPSSGTLVIQEPAPPEPVEIEAAPLEVPPQEKPAPRRRRPAASSADQVEDTTPAPTVEVPTLETRESPAQQRSLRQQIIETLGAVEGRITQARQRGMSAAEKQTFEDAETFIDQSRRALEGNDLARALNLARKASLIVNAVEGKP